MIRTSRLTKTFGVVRAVDDLNLSVQKGEILGFLGLNGAGKTTTFRMLLGMISPSSGQCFLQGQRVCQSNLDLWRNVGYMVERPSSYGELTVTENLELVRKLRGILDKRSVISIIEELGLQDHADKKAKHLSRGNSQRLGIAKALIHRPKILLLDEPTNGLDPAGIVQVRKLLLDLAADFGVTILVSSHKLDEISRLASRIAIIHHGKLIKELAVNELESQLHKSLVIAGKNLKAQLAVLSEAGYQLELDKNLQVLRTSNQSAVSYPERIATLLVNAGEPPTMLKVEREDLEKYFLRTIGEVGVESDA